MTLSRKLKAASFLMAVSGLGALASGAGPGARVATFAIPLALAAWFVPRKLMESRVWQTIWNGVVLAAFGASFLRIFSTGDPVPPIQAFVVLLVLTKLYNQVSARDVFHLYLTSIMALVGSAATNFVPSFLLLAAVHTAASIWTLALYQLRRDLEAPNFLKPRSAPEGPPVEPRRNVWPNDIPPRLWPGALAATVGVLIFAAVFFFLFPRTGAAPLRAGPGARLAQDVRLGDITELREDPTPVLRVTFDPRPPPALTERFLWRVAVLERYERGRWSRRTLRRSRLAGREVSLCRTGRPAGFVFARVLLLPETGGLLPLLWETWRVRLERPLPPGGMGLSSEPGAVVGVPILGRPVVYELQTTPVPAEPGQVPPLRPGACRLADDTLRSAGLNLRLPQDLPKAFWDLARRLSERGETSAAKVAAALEYLSPRNGYRYTKSPPRVPRGRDPVVHFLLTSRTGHCEYFASALTLLCRAMGVPARLAVGFVGGQWNAYGNYLVVRRSDAHAWTEVWLMDRGWVPVDATPPAASRPRHQEGLWARVGQYLDTLRRSYLLWVVDYDATVQFRLARRLRRHWGVLRLAVAVPVALTLLFVLARMLYRLGGAGHPSHGRRAPRTAARQMERLFRKLASILGPRPPGETMLHYAGRIPDDRLRAVVVEAVACYYELRYAPHPRQGLASRLADRVNLALNLLRRIPRNRLTGSRKVPRLTS